MRYGILYQSYLPYFVATVITQFFFSVIRFRGAILKTIQKSTKDYTSTTLHYVDLEKPPKIFKSVFLYVLQK